MYDGVNVCSVVNVYYMEKVSVGSKVSTPKRIKKRESEVTKIAMNQIFMGCQSAQTPVTVGYPLSVINKNSTIIGSKKRGAYLVHKNRSSNHKSFSSCTGPNNFF